MNLADRRPEPEPRETPHVSATATRRPWRFRDRLFLVLTANMAWVFVVGAPWLIEKSQILQVNSTRWFIPLMMPGAAAGDSEGGLDAEGFKHLVDEQVPFVEAVVEGWKRGMWVVAGLIGLCALLAALTGRSRMFQLPASVFILLSTIGTLVVIQLLVHPDYGGMEPLPIRSHVYVALGQSVYGWLLLAAFIRRPKARADRSARDP